METVTERTLKRSKEGTEKLMKEFYKDTEADTGRRFKGHKENNRRTLREHKDI